MNIWRNYRLFVPVVAVCCVLSGCSDIHRGDWVQVDGWTQDADAAGPRDVDQTEDSADPDVAGRDIPDTGIDVKHDDISYPDANFDAADDWLPDVILDVAQDIKDADGADVETVECPDVVCEGRECGPDPVCGISCGQCSQGYGCLQGDCVETGPMVLIPAGSFWMGCNEAVDTQCYEYEKPYHEVTLSGYFMDKTEVTQGEYKKCVDAGECAIPGCEWHPTGTPNRPVVCVDWAAASEYCTWAGKRLPTEAEWEKAARGTDGRKFPWGNETATCDYAVMYDGGKGCGTGSTWDVCDKSPAGDSPYGLCDMAGNVSEWASDWWDWGYYARSPSSNPTGPVGGFYRLVRGGSFGSHDVYLRASNRSDVDPSDGSGNLGFRCARSEVLPEVCDGADNDIDGMTDEDFIFQDWDDTLRTLAESCGTGACDGGHVECSLDGSYAECDTSHLASIELNNDIDDDCNGLTDDDYCTPDCTGLVCGPDPVCGASCGSCAGSDACVDGQCIWQADEYTVNCGADGMCFVPAGPFWMGCNATVDGNCNSDESPYHEVMLGGFYIDRTEVIQSEYQKCVVAGACDTPGCEWHPTGTPNRPVVCVDWAAASEYCTWAGKRLPTEAEWEKAARGTDGRKYPWGNETATCEYAVMDDGGGAGCGSGGVTDVCSKSPAGDSPYGLCDTAGNAWEWVSDWYEAGYYADSPLSNPTGPDSGLDRVTRGGSFGSNSASLRAPNRNEGLPAYYGGNLGFRCVRSEVEPETCDGVDNDIDGLTDEDFTAVDWDDTVRAVGDACGAGACAGGHVVCDTSKLFAVCSTDDLASPETVNGADDDCDGETDECPDVACTATECGIDPICGIDCGGCTGSDVCVGGQCVWQAAEYTVNCGADGMCLVPVGPFWMGWNGSVDNERWSNELPYHEVTLSGYYVDKTEVTVDAYGECVTAGSCTAPSTGGLCNWGVSGRGGHPVNCLDWTEAGEYCAWAGKRLPTEAEWEKAARGTDGRKYPWGNETATCEYAVMYGCPDDTLEVCSKSPSGDSPYGLCDMAGNVWEWVLDWYNVDYYASSPASNPTGPVSGSNRGIRGGGFGNTGYDYYLRASDRNGADPSDVYDFLGFRCVRDAQ